MEPNNLDSSDIKIADEDASSLHLVRVVRHDAHRHELSLILEEGQFIHFYQDGNRTIVAIGVDEPALAEVIADLNSLHQKSGFSFVVTISDPVGINEYRLHDTDSITPPPILLQKLAAHA